MVLAHDTSVKRTIDVKIAQDVTFDTMLLSSKTLQGLHEAGFYRPSPIQLYGIPLGKCGFDLLLEAKSGTGKTAVFSVISLEKLDLGKGLQCIIVTPTREIASQVCDVIKVIGSQYTDLSVEVVMGGQSLQDDIAKFKDNQNVHIVVGSPGRLRHLIQDDYIDTSAVRLLVLDEADKLMEKSFQADINYIFSTLPEQKQVIMSSATFPAASQVFIANYVKNPQHVCPDTTSILLGIEQKVAFVKYNSNIVKQTQLRYKELLKILTKTLFKQCLIFCNYQTRVTELHKFLTKDKWPSEQLFGQQEQTDRLDALRTLQEYKCRILVSTDLASRGIDASNVDLVINFEPPYEWQTYLHRIGRAGRFGSYGMAITLLSKGAEEIKFRKTLLPLGSSLNMFEFWTESKFILDNSFKESSNSLDSTCTCDNTENSENEADKDCLFQVLTCDNLEDCEIETKESLFKVLWDEVNTSVENSKDQPDFNNSDLISNVLPFSDLLQSFECDSFEHSPDIPYVNLKVDDAIVKECKGYLQGQLPKDSKYHHTSKQLEHCNENKINNNNYSENTINSNYNVDALDPETLEDNCNNVKETQRCEKINSSENRPESTNCNTTLTNNSDINDTLDLNIKNSVHRKTQSNTTQIHSKYLSETKNLNHKWLYMEEHDSKQIDDEMTCLVLPLSFDKKYVDSQETVNLGKSNYYNSATEDNGNILKNKSEMALSFDGHNHIILNETDNIESRSENKAIKDINDDKLNNEMRKVGCLFSNEFNVTNKEIAKTLGTAIYGSTNENVDCSSRQNEEMVRLGLPLSFGSKKHSRNKQNLEGNNIKPPTTINNNTTSAYDDDTIDLPQSFSKKNNKLKVSKEYSSKIKKTDVYIAENNGILNNSCANSRITKCASSNNCKSSEQTKFQKQSISNHDYYHQIKNTESTSNKKNIPTKNTFNKAKKPHKHRSTWSSVYNDSPILNSHYTNWYNELKFRVQQIQMSLYIQEMSYNF